MVKNSFKNKINSQPQLMEVSALTAFLEDFNTTLGFLTDPPEDTEPSNSANYNPDTNIGVIDISGTLTYRTEWWQQYLGGTSYESITAQMESLVGQGMKTLLLMSDSGGGEAYGVFETGDYIRKLADANGIKILAYVDGSANSACYALTSVADEIVANPQADVGSIGVVVQLRNFNKALQQAGIEDTYIFAGKNKIPFDMSTMDWSESFKNQVQSNVDKLYKEFTQYVANHRNTSVEAIEATAASSFNSDDALKLGLIDSVMTHEEFYTYLADYVQKEKKPEMFKNKLFNLNSEQETVEMKELETLTAELSALKVSMEAEVAAKASLQAEMLSLKASLEDTAKKVVELEAQKVAVEAQLNDKIKAEKDEKLESRKKSLADVLPEDKVEAAFSVLANVDDAVFNLAVDGYATKELSKLTSFKEVGSEGEAVDHGKPDEVQAQVEFNKTYFKTV